MMTVRTIALFSAVSLACVTASISGCEKKSEPAKPTASKPTDPPSGNDQGQGHHGGATTQLGEQAAGGYTIKASRDGAITPGKDAPIDVWVTGGTDKVAAVRFWIGTQDAKGSAKAKAELEKDNWHTHAEIPSPLPTGSRLWVEVETDMGQKHVAGFDLKQ